MQKQKSPTPTKPRKRKSRGNGEGSISKYRDGFRWQVREEVNGKIKVIASGIEKTRLEADKALSKVKADRARGLFSCSSTITLGEWLTNWLEYKKPHLRATTFEQYELRLRLYVPEQIKALRLQEVKRSHIIALEADLSKKIAASTRRTVIGHLSSAFKEALRQDLVFRNPADDIKVTATVAEQAKPARRKALSDEELRQFLTAAAHDPVYPIIYVMFSLGLRCSEVLGLTWQDVNFADRSIQLRQGNALLRNKPTLGKLKTKNSIRALPTSTDLLEVLRRHQQAQDALRQEWGTSWPDFDLIFTTGQGTPLDRHNVWRSIQRICKAAGVEPFGTHSGRHTNITTLLRNGLSPEVVAKLAGHARVSTTYNIYRQVMPDEIRAAEFDLGAHLARTEAAD